MGFKGHFLVVFGVFLGCGSRTSVERLEEALFFFHTHLKTQEVERAAAYVAPEGYEDFASLHHPERNVFRIEEFSVASMIEDPEHDRMVVVVLAVVRKHNSITMQTIRLKETWEKRRGRWFLVSEKILPQGAPIEGGGKRPD